MKPTARPLTSRRPAQPLHGIIRVPGDRTISHRALVLAGLAVGETRIAGLPESDGMVRIAAALRALGAEVVRDGPGAWRAAGRGVGGLRRPAGRVRPGVLLRFVFFTSLGRGVHVCVCDVLFFKG